MRAPRRVAAWAAAMTLASAVAAAPPQQAIVVDGSGVGLRSLAAIQAMVQTTHEAGFDTVIPIVRSLGDAHYPSTREPRAGNVAIDLPDPLGSVISAARASIIDGEAMNVIAGLNVLMVHRGATLPPIGHVSIAHPDWLMQDTSGNHEVREGGVLHHFMDPSLIEVRQHLEQVVAQVIANHDLDGIAFDALRYPEGGTDWGFSPMALERYHAVAGDVGVPAPGDAAFTRWRREQVTELLRTLVRAVRTMEPELPIWVCVEAAGSISGGFQASRTYTGHLQDWQTWIDEGLVDGLIIKIFRDGRDTEGAAEFLEWQTYAREVAAQIPALIAVSGRHNYRNSLFTQMRGVSAAGLGIALYDFDQPARDAGQRFYANLHRVVLQPRQGLVPATAAPASPAEIPSDVMSDILAEEPVSPESAPPPPEDIPAGDLGEPVPASPDVSALLPPPGAPEPPPVSEADLIFEEATDEALPLTPPPDEPMIDSTFTPGVFDDLPPVEIPSPARSPLRPSATVDVVHLEGGRQIAGTIAEETEAELSVRLDSGSLVRVPRSRVVSIERGQR